MVWKVSFLNRQNLYNFGMSEKKRFLFFYSFSFLCDAILFEKGIEEGHVIVFDMTGISLSHVARLTIMAIKNFLYYLQEALPFRLKGLHFINIVPFIDKIIFLMKPFMKKELWDVFHLHSNMDTVYKMIDANVFPNDYTGGEADSLDHFHGMDLSMI